MTNGERFFCQTRRFDAGILCVFQGKATRYGGKRSAVWACWPFFIQGLMSLEFQSLIDVKIFIKEIAEHLPAHAPYRDDFEFFGSINCTTTSEYRQELKRFLETFIAETAILSMPDTVEAVYPKLVKLYGWL